jgi:succinate---hydroxymethylglutarate CoA-transferase
MMRSDLLGEVRVLAEEQYGAGPSGTQVLGDPDAEIIKVGHPAGGDVARSAGPCFRDDLPDAADSFFSRGLNRDKKSLTLDLHHDEGKQIFRSGLAPALGTDTGGLLSELGISPDQPAELQKGSVI